MRKGRLVARRYQVVRHRTRLKNEVHSIVHAHLIPKCPHADLFNRRGRAWLSRRALPDDERAAIERHIRELDRLGEDLDLLDREIAESVLDDPAIKRLMTITGVNLTVAVGLVAAIGDIARFSSPQKLVSYFGLNPRVRQSVLGAAHHGRISKIGRSHARAMLVEAAWAAAKALGPLHAFFVRIRARRGRQVAAVAVARKLAVLCWHMLNKEEDYLWARPVLVAHKLRAMELQAGRPAGRTRRGTGADRPTPKHQGAAQPGDRSHPPGRAELRALCRQLAPTQATRRGAGASSRQGLIEAARRRFQPGRRSSPRGRPRTSHPATASKKAHVHQPGGAGVIVREQTLEGEEAIGEWSLLGAPGVRTNSEHYTRSTTPTSNSICGG